MPKEYERDLSIPEPLDVKIDLSLKLTEGELSDFEERVFKFAAGFYLTIL